MITNVLLQAAAPGGQLMPFFMIGMIVVMYFFMIRPQQKKAKEQKLFAEKIAAGEKVVLTSGIHGRITRTNDDGTLTIEIDRNTAITVERQAVSMEMTQAYLKKIGMETAAKVVS